MQTGLQMLLELQLGQQAAPEPVVGRAVSRRVQRQKCVLPLARASRWVYRASEEPRARRVHPRTTPPHLPARPFVRLLRALQDVGWGEGNARRGLDAFCVCVCGASGSPGQHKHTR